MQDRITRSRMAGDPPEITLVPMLEDFALMDFHRAHEAIREGRRLVEAHAAQIRAWAGLPAMGKAEAVPSGPPAERRAAAAVSRPAGAAPAPAPAASRPTEATPGAASGAADAAAATDPAS